MPHKCDVCDDEALFACADCADRFYCSEDCQIDDLDEHYEQCDYEGVTERVGISILGVGPWKRIVRKHIELTRAYLGWALKGDSAKMDSAVSALIKQFGSWTRQFVPRSDRDELHRILLKHTTLVKKLIDTAMRFRMRPTQFDSAISNILGSLFRNGDEMRDFWDKRSSVTQHKATSIDYENAWKFHLNCTLDYVKASVFNTPAVFNAMYQRCLLGGDALGAVFNGNRWKEPRAKAPKTKKKKRTPFSRK